MAIEKESTSPTVRTRQQYAIYGGLIILLLVVVGYVAYTILSAPPEVSAERLALEPVLGNTAAPVQIVEYGTYGCPSCRGVHDSGLLEQLMQTYGDDIQLIFRNFPVIDPNDPNAAEAAQCALDQGNDAFWIYHEALFETPLNSYTDYGKDEFVSLADESGLNADAMKDCLDKDTHERTVEHWEADAEDAGVRGTPTFFVNGTRLNSPEQLEEAVQQALGL